MTPSGVTSSAERPFLEVDKVTKRFPGVLAVEEARLLLRRGEIVGLVGKNGAGKSTLIRILAGVERPDSGEVRIDGEMASPYTPRDARDRGLRFVHQELNDVPELTAAENLALGLGFPRRLRVLIDRGALRERAAEVLGRLEIGVRPDTRVKELSSVQRRIVMIASALYQNARLIVLDEPTASLTLPEIRQLHEVLRALSRDGVSILYVSHRLGEVLDLCERVVVMRNGRTVTDHSTEGLSRGRLLASISGGVETDLESASTTGAQQIEGAGEVLRIEGLTRTGVVEDVSMSVNAGEIVGLGGLVGSGRTELARMIVGADRPTSGRVFVEGREVQIGSPADALRYGIVLLPEDRRHQALIGHFGIRHNMTLAGLRQFRHMGPLPLISRRRERTATRRVMSDLEIEAPDEDKAVAALSGGNQQKVVLGRWLLHGAKVLLFDEPTQGIDVGVKEEIFRLIRALAAEGNAIIFISSELAELERVCGRVLVLREGRAVRMLEGDEVTEREITNACFRRREPADSGRR
jgi:ribose transport system ATP-binding protein